MSNQDPTANSNDEFPAEPFTQGSAPEQPREAAAADRPDHGEGTAERQQLETEDTDDEEFDEDEDDTEEDTEEDERDAAPDPTDIPS